MQANFGGWQMCIQKRNAAILTCPAEALIKKIKLFTNDNKENFSQQSCEKWFATKTQSHEPACRQAG